MVVNSDAAAEPEQEIDCSQPSAVLCDKEGFHTKNPENSWKNLRSMDGADWMLLGCALHSQYYCCMLLNTLCRAEQRGAI